MDRRAPELEVIEHLSDAQLEQLLTVMGTAWWARDRTVEDLQAAIAGSQLVIGLVDRTQRPDGELVAFARVLTDFAFLAVILDVIVAEKERGRGAGARLLQEIVQHPRLAHVRSLELVCQPDLVPFYQRWGFTTNVGRSTLMRRTTDARLSPPPSST
jgi:GNAT superfamily N-acetyltransferase